MMVARNTSWSDLVGIPRSRSTRSAYGELEQAANSELTWSAAFILSFSTTPSAVILCTWGIPMQGGASADLQWGRCPVNMTSFDFDQFNFKLFPSAQVWTCVWTSARVDRWNYYISVISKLDKRVAGVDWLEVWCCDNERRWTKDTALDDASHRISANSEVVPINLVQCECPMKKSLIQL